MQPHLEVGHVLEEAALEAALHVGHHLGAVLGVVAQLDVDSLHNVLGVQLLRGHHPLRQVPREEREDVDELVHLDEVHRLGLADLPQVVHHVLERDQVLARPVQLLVHGPDVVHELRHIEPRRFVKLGRIPEKRTEKHAGHEGAPCWSVGGAAVCMRKGGVLPPNAKKPEKAGKEQGNCVCLHAQSCDPV